MFKNLSVLVFLLGFTISSGALAASPSKSIDDFDRIITEVLDLYENTLSKKLVAEKNWDDESLRVEPRDKPSHFSLYIAGGLYRLKSITPDAFALMLCHEIGHFTGGAPVYGEKAITPEEKNLSAEGQADYWAASKCFRKVFAGKDNLQFMKDFKKEKSKRTTFKELLPEANRQCTKVWGPSESAVALCERTIVAARSFARTARIKGNEKYWVNITTPSPIVAPYTHLFHPPAQCRFDTFVAGALCEISSSVDTDQSSLDQGVCSRGKGYTSAARPLCWFRPI